MSYQQMTEYLFSRLPMFSKIGAEAIKADLTNAIILCKKLGNPQNTFKSIHIAGTNGKGSTSHMLAAILSQAGYKTGLYTSPHLRDFRERIRVNGKMIGKQEVIGFVEKMKPLIEEINPSFFEISMAMAFDHFAKENVDIAIIEAGLGGRLDSTNIITPELSVITNISFDHTDFLGDTIEKISAEKAGIIKKNIPVIIGETNEKSKPVFIKKAIEENSPIYFAEGYHTINTWESKTDHVLTRVKSLRTHEIQEYHLDLTGSYQKKNLLTILESVNQLTSLGYNINREAIFNGLKHVRTLTGLQGRWETIKENPRVITDVAHNVAGIVELAEQLKSETYDKLHIVIGLVKDKDISSILSLLPQSATYYFTQAAIPRALNAEELQKQAEQFGLKGNAYTSVIIAVDTAVSFAGSTDLVLVCGSVFVVGEAKI